MASLDQHFQQWKHNRQLLSIIPASHHDWLVTVSFYTALHAVDSLLTHDETRGINCHEARNRALAETNRYRQIFKCYSPLYDLSRRVRYLANPQGWVSWDQIMPEIIEGRLYPVEKSVQKLMGKQLDLPPIHLLQPKN